jgi:alpha-tubulin suppressor-like RCC1 family protein
MARRTAAPRRSLLVSSLGLTWLVATPLVAAALAGYTTSDVAFSWGNDAAGQLGNGVVSTSANQFNSPGAMQTPDGVRFREVCSGANATVAIDTDAKLWAWGVGPMLGAGATVTQSAVPVAVAASHRLRFVSISCGDAFAVAIDTTGHAWEWGGPNLPGNTAAVGPGSYVPIEIPAPAGAHFVTAAAGDDPIVIAIDSKGQAWSWGQGDGNRLGDGTTSPRAEPGPVTMPAGVRFVSVSMSADTQPTGFAVALDSTGQAWVWGPDQYLGDGLTSNSTGSSLVPVSVNMPAGVRFSTLSAGSFFAVALSTTGEVWGWGDDDAGPLGILNGCGGLFGGICATPTEATMPTGIHFTSLTAGNGFSAATDQDGRLWTWGADNFGDLGTGTQPVGNANDIPTPAAGIPRNRAVDAVFAGEAAGSTTALALPPVKAPASVSTIASSLTTPSRAFNPVSSMLISGTLAAGGALLLTFPAEIFNATFDQNYEEIRDSFKKRATDLRTRLHLTAKKAHETHETAAETTAAEETKEKAEAEGRRGLAFVVVLAFGGILGCLNDPGFGFSGKSAITYIGVLLAMVIGVAIPAGVAAVYHRRRHGSAPAQLRALPLGLLIAALCVLMSRLTGFQPGYLYGVVCGIVFSRSLPTNERGHIAALCAYTMLAVSFAAWFAWVPVNHGVARSGGATPLLLLDDLLASLFVSGLVGTALGMLPLRFLAGGAVKAWHRGAWAVTFVVSLFAVVQIMLLPHGHRAGAVPLVTTIVLFVIFGVVSLWFRDHWEAKAREREGKPEPSWRKRLRESLRPARSRDATSP